MTRTIIYVPGKNLKPEPAAHQHYLWCSVINGVERIDPAIAGQMQAQPNVFQLAAWNYLYYGKHGCLSSDIPWIEKLFQISVPSDADLREARNWRKAAAQIAYEFGDRFHGLVDWIPDNWVKSMIEDTAPYFENTSRLGDQVRETVKLLLRRANKTGDRVLLIGHSMGAVIAYDALWQLSREENTTPVDLFLTLGSPLGLNYVQRRLLGGSSKERTYPGGIELWENVSATGDLISLDKTVGDDFGSMVDQGLAGRIVDHCGGVFNWFRNENGLNVHRSYGYLVNPVVGRIIADWWTGQDRHTEPVLIGHRGYPSKFPENTRLGFERALDTGVGYVELDVQLTRDLVPVVYHDRDTKRVSGTKGNVLDLTHEEFICLEASHPARFGDAFRGNPVMLLSELSSVLEQWPRAGAFIEIKADSLDRFGIEITVDRIIADITPVIGRCVVISFRDDSLEYARAKYGVPIGWVLPRWNRATETRARRLDPDYIFSSVSLMPDDTCALWRGRWQWGVYVVDDADQANTYPKRGVTFVETDSIGEMRSALENHHQ